MRRKTAYYSGMLLFAAAVLMADQWTVSEETAFAVSSVKRGRGVSVEQADTALPYSSAFTLRRYEAGKINCFVLKHGTTDYQSVKLYASLYHMPEEAVMEDEEAYRFTGAEGTLIIYKNTRRLTFLAAPARSSDLGTAAVTGAFAINEAEAAAYAAAFLEAHMLYAFSEETRVTWDGEHFIVTFSDRIGQIKSHAFNHTVTLDRYGRVLQADYFFVQYEKISACKIKSLREAFSALPEESSAHMQDAQLVYVYEESIIQPAYMFTVDDFNGNALTYYVKAAVYDA